MSARKTRPPIPAIALPTAEAAAALGMGESAFREHVAPELKVILRGRMRLYPVAELERWAEESAIKVMEDR